MQGLCPACVDIFGTETWAMEKENLHILDIEDGADDGEMDVRGVAQG